MSTPMTSPLFALQAAIVTRLNGDAALNTLLGGRKCYQRVPPGMEPPWIAYEDASARKFDASSHEGHEHRVSLICVSRQPGTRDALAIAERVSQLLHDEGLTLDGHRLVNLTVLSVDLLRVGKDAARRARVALRAFTEVL